MKLIMNRGISMKRLEVVLILIICQGVAQCYPIHASNGAFNCTVYGEFKDNYLINEPGEDRNIVLNVDVSLVKSNGTGSYPAQANYSLVDYNNKTYPTRGELTRSLRPGRQLLGFAVPPDTIPKMLIVDPSGSPQGSDRLMVNFGELTNGTNGLVNLLYYGVLNSKIESNLQSTDFDVGVTNRGTNALPLGSKNFSLLDQWGERYDSLAYSSYRNVGFKSRDLKPKEMARMKVSFGSMSPLSRPSKLVYEYSNTSSIVLNIDPEGGLLQNVNISKNCSCQSCGYIVPKPPALNSSTEQSVLSRLSGTLKATRAVLHKSDNFLSSNVHVVKDTGGRQKAVLGNSTTNFQTNDDHKTTKLG